MASAMPPGGRKCSGCSANSSYSGLRKLELDNYFIREISVPHWPPLTNRTSHRACDEVQESPPLCCCCCCGQLLSERTIVIGSSGVEEYIITATKA
jgi:hypothetical protein